MGLLKFPRSTGRDLTEDSNRPSLDPSISVVSDIRNRIVILNEATVTRFVPFNSFHSKDDAS
jgi:hypothetical protein